MNAAETKKWMEQWRAAGPALEAFRAEELGRLDESQNAVIASSFFAAENRTTKDWETSGLVEQQAIFLRALTR
jgi:hypothetical protein